MNKKSIYFRNNRLSKIQQILTNYQKIEYKPLKNYSYVLPQFSLEEYEVKEVTNLLKEILIQIDHFFNVKLEFPIFLTLKLVNLPNILNGYYVLSLKEKKLLMISKIKEDEQSEKFFIEINYFIDIEKIIYSENYPNYIKSLIEIGRLDEYIVSKISSLDSINIERCFLETNRYTRIQNINITKKVLTQTTIISEG